MYQLKMKLKLHRVFYELLKYFMNKHKLSKTQWFFKEKFI